MQILLLLWKIGKQANQFLPTFITRPHSLPLPLSVYFSFPPSYTRPNPRPRRPCSYASTSNMTPRKQGNESTNASLPSPFLSLLYASEPSPFLHNVLSRAILLLSTLPPLPSFPSFSILPSFPYSFQHSLLSPLSLSSFSIFPSFPRPMDLMQGTAGKSCISKRTEKASWRGRRGRKKVK